MYGYRHLGGHPAAQHADLLGLGTSTWLGVPTGLATANVAATTIDLTWNAPAGSIDHYRVYKNGVFLATNADTSYTATSLTAETEYSFQVSAVNATSQESSLTAPVLETTIAA
jgi:chitodextrinase